MKISELKTYLNKVLVFYNPEKAGYWNSLTKCCITQKAINLGDYYLDFSSKAAYPEDFSNNGIPLFSYRGQPKIEQPIVIAQYALGLNAILHRNRSTDKNTEEKFITTAKWFLDNKKSFKDGSAWFIYHLYPHYNLNSPWLSAMAQGEAISVLTRAAKLSGDQRFENLANEAISPFEYDVKDGGVRNYFNTFLIYEEFPTPIKPMAVLNGFIFSLFGLYDLFLLNGNKKALYLFDEGIRSLVNLLPYYDLKNWTRYFLFDYPNKYYSSFTYHFLVTEQLKALYYLTDKPEFLDYYKRWNGYSNSFIKKSLALLNKLVYANKFIPDSF